MRMSHPRIRSTIDVPDEPGTIAVHREAGWVEEHDAEQQQHPALVAGEPAPESEPATSSTSSKRRQKNGPVDATPAP